jgi:hypothetical protein
VSYPTPSDYQDALQAPASAFADPELQAATPRTNVLGLPQPITGAFAAVFPMTTEQGATVAVKGFLQAVEDQQERYAAIADHLQAADLDATIAFDYQASGIRVHGTAYPLLKMEWVDGTTLRRFVEAHRDEPEVLQVLAERWADTVATLEAATVAHGDLQHGNVLIEDTSNGPSIRLVDYDTMYVPALQGRRSAEVGHRNFQHPDRTEVDFGPYVDRFAALVIYTALRACAERPDLWDRFDAGENLLFRDADFYDPDASPLFDALHEIEAIAPLPDLLRRACFVDPDQVPSLRDVETHAGAALPEAPASRSRRDGSSERTPSRTGWERAVLPAGVSVLATGALLAAAGFVAAGAAVVVVAGVLGAWWMRRQYRRRPLVRRRQRLASEIERLDERIEGLRRQIESLRTKRQRVLNTIDAQRAERLQEVQEDALRDRLKHHFVGEAREIDGVTHKHVVRLKATNIRTAYEATPERVASIRQLDDETKARLQMWRSSLVNQYEAEIPDALSPAEERRLQRYVQHRVDDIDDAIARTTEKVEVQTVERDRLRERRDDMPRVSWVRYVRYLSRLGTWPDRGGRSPAPSGSTATTTTQPEPEPVPDMASESDGPWWT